MEVVENRKKTVLVETKFYPRVLPLVAGCILQNFQIFSPSSSVMTENNASNAMKTYIIPLFLSLFNLETINCRKYPTNTRIIIERSYKVAVVVAFFVCWAPFHAQRLMTLYVKQWTSQLLELQSQLFYVSGVLYFLSSTVNPILYNVLSRRFRQAFKRTLCRCCINLQSLPTLYKLKAIFIQDDRTSLHSVGRYLYPRQSTHTETFFKIGNAKKDCWLHDGKLLQHKSRLETSTRSTCNSHAHSDGRPYYLCRHKRRHTGRSIQFANREGNALSDQNIECFQRKQPCEEKYQILDTSNKSVSSEGRFLKITLQI